MAQILEKKDDKYYLKYFVFEKIHEIATENKFTNINGAVFLNGLVPNIGLDMRETLDFPNRKSALKSKNVKISIPMINYLDDSSNLVFKQSLAQQTPEQASESISTAQMSCADSTKRLYDSTTSPQIIPISEKSLKDKLAVFRQDRIITPEQHTKQSHKRTKSAPNIGV